MAGGDQAHAGIGAGRCAGVDLSRERVRQHDKGSVFHQSPAKIVQRPARMAARRLPQEVPADIRRRVQHPVEGASQSGGVAFSRRSGGAGSKQREYPDENVVSRGGQSRPTAYGAPHG